jgi:hypothetical protein
MKATNDESGHSSLTVPYRLAKGLGWFSIGLGLTELAFPGAIGRMLGLEDRQGLIRAYGAREIAAGVGALSIDPAPAIWARAAGDLVDLATLAMGLKAGGEARRNAAVAIAAVAGITVVDVLVASSIGKATARPAQVRDYGDRSGFPAGARAAREQAADFEAPDDMRAAFADREGALESA